MVAMRGMMPARIAAVLVLVVSYGALSARQPAVRTSMPLPITAEQLSASVGLGTTDHNQLLLSIVRLVFEVPDGSSAQNQTRRAALSAQLKGSSHLGAISVPLPLDTSIWRETILGYPIKDSELAATILSDRSTALLYYGLAALDDDTLGWLGPDRETLLYLRRNAAAFAAFGRSVRIRGGRVTIPGGDGAEPIWTAIVGADPERPSIFVQRLFRGNGRLAWFYDTIQHLDREHQRLVFGDDDSESVRIERTRALLDVFESAAPEWKIPDRPFERPALGPSVVVSRAAVNGSGGFSGPDSRKLWELVFRERGETASTEASGDPAADDHHALEPSWLARRISLVPAHLGRARLETFLFAQRCFPKRRAEEAATVAALRGAMAFPALALTLENIGVTDVATYAAAARAAAALNAIRSPEWRTVAIAEFQSSLAIVLRAVRLNGLDPEDGVALASSLIGLPVSANQGYGDFFVHWLQQHRVAILGREQPRLDAQLTTLAADASESARLARERSLAETLKTVVYTGHLSASGGLVAAHEIASRHNLGSRENPTGRAWQLPREDQGPRGWRLSGSLLGVDVPLGRLAVASNARP